ncbi:hypothetical protein BDK51DRAFT_52416 [Blyttiomyces helicus]|uniref:Uncharacterized protein n=1 Tax=Blyttiomyces helicus TaxID=388810 RepID=A0A4P9W796_9FUNG|nr:hypothetical protein BDK51DRAFT_52416 [Blyttiomyces helicus]|eukprot:RKO86888.1 hypothetical protein BDK51DRAFT_52416 [Blyttiomyces helicus]
MRCSALGASSSSDDGRVFLPCEARNPEPRRTQNEMGSAEREVSMLKILFVSMLHRATRQPSSLVPLSRRKRWQGNSGVKTQGGSLQEKGLIMPWDWLRCHASFNRRLQASLKQPWSDVTSRSHRPLLASPVPPRPDVETCPLPLGAIFNGPNRELNPGPPAPEAGIMRLDHWAIVVGRSSAFIYIPNTATPIFTPAQGCGLAWTWEVFGACTFDGSSLQGFLRYLSGARFACLVGAGGGKMAPQLPYQVLQWKLRRLEGKASLTISISLARFQVGTHLVLVFGFGHRRIRWNEAFGKVNDEQAGQMPNTCEVHGVIGVKINQKTTPIVAFGVGRGRSPNSDGTKRLEDEARTQMERNVWKVNDGRAGF